MNDDDLDALLRQNLLQPPTDFTQRVMKNLATQIQPLPHSHAHSSPHRSAEAAHLPLRTSGRARQRPAVWPCLRWMAARAGLVGGGLLGFVLGLDQLAAFVYGVWLAGAAL